MAWTIQGNLKGPKGDPGDPGTAGVAGGAGPAGPAGAEGKPGAGISLQGSETPTDLDAMRLHPHDAGKAWLLSADGTVGGHAMLHGHMVVWDGTAWHDAGEIVGPPGPRGTRWFTGSGAPGTLTGQQAKDMYLDRATGDVYELS